MPSLRPSRKSSRTSSPFVRSTHDPPPTNVEPKKEKAQSSLLAWVEPAPAAPRPSFEEHGFARGGVLENMQPLGVPPSAKLKAKIRATYNDPKAKAFFGRNGNIAPVQEPVSTPEMTPTAEPEQYESDKPEEQMPIIATTPRGVVGDEDDEYIPNVAKVSSRSGKTPMKNGPVTPTPVPQPVSLNTTNVNIQNPEVRQRIHMVVNECRARANAEGKPITGEAVKDMFDQSAEKQDLQDLLEQIIRRKIKPTQLEKFHHFIKASKSRLKKLAKRRGSSAVDPSKSDVKPISSLTPSNNNNNFSIATIDTLPTNPSHVTIDVPSIETVDDRNGPVPDAVHPSVQTSDEPSSVHIANSPQPIATNDLALYQGSSRGPSFNSSGPRSRHSSVQATSPLGESESDLSDYNEEIVQNGPPEALATKTGSNNQLKRKILNPKAGGGKKSRGTSAKPQQPINGKRPADWIEWTEEETIELSKRRESMVTPYPEFDSNVSEVRDTHDGVFYSDNESLASSQIHQSLENGNGTTRRSTRPRKGTPKAGTPMPPPASRRGSAATRPGTPALAPPAPKRLKLNNGQAAKTKRSPIKNRDGPVAGVVPRTRLGGGPGTPIGDDNNAGTPSSDNDDYCAACSGGGHLVCCDSCNRSFHFTCCDPPLNESDDDLPAVFNCHVCKNSARATEERASRDRYHGMGPLFDSLERMNTKSFALPDDIRNHYEGVRTGRDGAYDDSVKKIPLSKGAGYGSQKPDYYKVLDGSKHFVLCCQCGKSAVGKRAILQCDYCHEWWHLDCINPPLANPPAIPDTATHRDPWKCPRHTDHDFRSGQILQQDLNVVAPIMTNGLSPFASAPRKVRKPRNPVVVEPALSRGSRNNGLIDIVNDPDDDTDGEGNYVFPTVYPVADEKSDQNGKIFRMPERGIILDFIDKVKADNAKTTRIAKIQAKKAKAARASALARFAERPLAQQQAALELTQLAKKEKDIGMDGTDVHALVFGLMAEAPANIVSDITRAQTKQLSEQKKAELLKLRNHIDQLLNGSSIITS